MLSLMLTLGCGPQKVQDMPVETLESETLSTEPIQGVAPLADMGWLLSSTEGLQEWHPLGTQGTWVWDRPGVLYSAVRTPELGLVVSMEEGLLSGQGLLGPSPMQEQVGAAGTLYAAGDGLVLQSSLGVFAWRAGELFELSGYGGSIATGRDGSIYLQQGRDQVHLVRSGLGWAELERERSSAFARGLDGEGILWTLGADVLTRSDGLSWELPTETVSLHVCAQSAGAWVEDEEGTVWFFDAEPRVRAELPEGAVLDGQCRWLVADFRGLERLSWGRPVGLWGMYQGEEVIGDTPLAVLPTLPERVSSVSLRVNGEAQDLVDDAWVLERADWPQGGTLEVVVTYEDSVTSTLQRTFSIGEVGEPTWAEDIEFIYKDHCALCHNNGTETVLADAQDWEDSIEAILSSVSSGAMPLGKTPLTGAQIATIRAWRDGGFQ